MSSVLRKILYVEDENALRQVTTMAMEMMGSFQVLACASGEEAVEKGENFGPDLILIDMRMPGMDGWEALSALRRISVLSETPVIFVTGNRLAKQTAEKEPGVIGWIQKPYNSSAFLEQLGDLWSSL